MSPRNDLLILNRRDLEGLGLTWPEIVDVLEDAFRQKAQGLVTNPPKPKVTSRDDAFIHAMPAYLGGSDRIGLKWVSGYEQNHAKGLPYIFGSVIMNDSETGRPIALLDGGWITEMRTPGVSGVTMRHVPGASRRLAIVGCGVQGRRHLEVALAEHPEIEEVVAYDYADEATQRLLDLAGDRQTRVAESPTDAVAGADLVITTITVPLDPKLDTRNTELELCRLHGRHGSRISSASQRPGAHGLQGRWRARCPGELNGVRRRVRGCGGVFCGARLA